MAKSRKPLVAVDMGRKKTKRPSRPTRIYDEAWEAVNILRGYTKEEFVGCLSRLAEEMANREIAVHQKAWQDAQVRKPGGNQADDS